MCKSTLILNFTCFDKPLVNYFALGRYYKLMSYYLIDKLIDTTTLCWTITQEDLKGVNRMVEETYLIANLTLSSNILNSKKVSKNLNVRAI